MFSYRARNGCSLVCILFSISHSPRYLVLITDYFFIDVLVVLFNPLALNTVCVLSIDGECFGVLTIVVIGKSSQFGTSPPLPTVSQ